MTYLDQLTLSPNPEGPTLAEAASNYGVYLAEHKEQGIRAGDCRPPIEGVRTALTAVDQMVNLVYDQPVPANESAMQELGEFGKTILTSEALARAGLRHYVMVSGSRSGVLVRVKTPSTAQPEDLVLLVNRRQKVRDAQERVAPITIGSALIDTTVARLASQVNGHPITARLNAAHLAGQTQRLKLSDMLTRSCTVQSERQLPNGNWRLEHVMQGDTPQLVMRIFSAPQGREMLHAYGDFRRAATSGDIALARGALEKLPYYPVTDEQAPHCEIRSLVENACKQGAPARETINLITTYFEKIYAENNDARLHALEADLYHLVATQTASPVAVRKRNSAMDQTGDAWLANPEPKPLSRTTGKKRTLTRP